MLTVLAKRAEVYVDSLLLELGAPLSLDQGRTFQQALLQDFVEVYNLGRRASVDLPVGRPGDPCGAASCLNQE
jgi:hypothetical protein